MAFTSRIRQRAPCRSSNWPEFDDDSPLRDAARPSARENHGSRRSSEPISFRSCKAGSPRPRTASCTRVRPRSLSLPSTRQARLTYEPGPAADPGRASSRAFRLDRNAARRPRASARLVAPSRPEQPARADHERPEELLDDHLSSGAEKTFDADIPNTRGRKIRFRVGRRVSREGDDVR